MHMMLVPVLIGLALLLDGVLGEPKRYHPLVGFGRMATLVELVCRGGSRRFLSRFRYGRRFLGVLAWLVSIVPFVVFVWWVQTQLSLIWRCLFDTVILYLCVGQTSLKQHGMAVYEALCRGDLASARRATSCIVSRDVQMASETQLVSATVETITENTHDAIIAPMIFYVLLGPAGAVLFRLSNTLDAMWGYRNERYEEFGKWSARVDDVLGWLPAKITAMMMLLDRPKALIEQRHQVRRFAKGWYSANAGWVMAAGGFALNLKLGGDASYHGKLKVRPWLSLGREPSALDIKRAVSLMYRTSLRAWCLVFMASLMWWLG